MTTLADTAERVMADLHRAVSDVSAAEQACEREAIASLEDACQKQKNVEATFLARCSAIFFLAPFVDMASPGLTSDQLASRLTEDKPELKLFALALVRSARDEDKVSHAVPVSATLVTRAVGGSVAARHAPEEQNVESAAETEEGKTCCATM